MHNVMSFFNSTQEKMLFFSFMCVSCTSRASRSCDLLNRLAVAPKMVCVIDWYNRLWTTSDICTHYSFGLRVGRTKDLTENVHILTVDKLTPPSPANSSRLILVMVYTKVLITFLSRVFYPITWSGAHSSYFCEIGL
jgi:hypothetical protein